MIFKFGTQNALQRHKEEMPCEVFSHLRYSIDLLDENYGADRDIDHDDGGFCSPMQRMQTTQNVLEGFGLQGVLRCLVYNVMPVGVRCRCGSPCR